MNNKLLVALSLIAVQAMAMELTIDNEQATPMNTEEKVVIPIQDQERELPARFIPLIGTLAGFYVKDSPLQMSPITMVSLDTWQLIENQLERVYAMNQGSQQVKDEIIADYSKLDNTEIIDLTYAIDFLDIPLLKEITLEIAQDKFTFDEILELTEYGRNEIIKRKALSRTGPMPVKEIALCVGHEDIVRSVCVTPDGKIVSGSEDTTVRIWDMNGNQLAVCRGHEDIVRSVCVTSDGKIISGSDDKTVRIWDMNGQELAVCRGHDHEGWIRSVCVTPDGKIISCSWMGIVRVWNINGQHLAVCREYTVFSVCVAPNGKIVFGSPGKTVDIWDMNGQEFAICRGHEGWVVRSVCVTPDGRIVSGSDDHTVRVWDMNGNQLAVCRGHCAPVESVYITPDGKIVSKSDDRYYAVRIWDMNGRQLAVCRGQKGRVGSECITPDGKIVTGSVKVQIWDISLLDRLSIMNKKQALAMCKLLQSATCENQRQKDRCWIKITRILEEEELVVETKKRKATGNRKNNPGKRLRRLPKEEDLGAETK